MLLFSSKVGLAALQLLLNAQVTSTLKIHSILALFVTLKSRIVICIFPEVKFSIFPIIRTLLRNLAVFPPFYSNWTQCALPQQFKWFLHGIMVVC